MSSDATWKTAFTGSGMSTYDDVLVPRLFEPWGALLLDVLAVRPGEAVLDVATGPGSVARLAAARVGPAGRVTGADISPAMLALATAKPPVEDGAAIDYVQCPADALDVAGAAYDVVTCQHGLQFFPDRPAALREMRRAARTGGRLGLAVWRDIAESPVFAALADAIDVVLGADAAATYRGGPWGLSDGDLLASLVAGAGWSDVRVEAHERDLELASVGQALEVLAFAIAGVVELDEAGRAELVRRTATDLEPLTTASGAVRAPTTAHLVVATAT